MAARRTRYNELLDVPNDVRDPDLYQLLGLDRARFDPHAVDEAYKDRMRRLQAVRSPKHKAFIEFLKGELRRARTALTDPARRAEYDAELLEERREQLGRILDVVLADGLLTQVEEERIRAVAADVGLLPGETDAILSEELPARGARREEAAAAPVAEERPARAASSLEIQRVVERRLRPGTGATARPSRRPPPPTRSRPARRPRAPAEPAPRPEPVEHEDEEVVTAELVAPGPSEVELPRAEPVTPAPDWGRVARSAQQTGWGRASADARIGVCAGCLEQVTQQHLDLGRAERLPDGRLHCPACTNQLVAGLLCGLCYQRITREDMRGGALVITGAQRVVHGACARPPASGRT